MLVLAVFHRTSDPSVAFRAGQMFGTNRLPADRWCYGSLGSCVVRFYTCTCLINSALAVCVWTLPCPGNPGDANANASASAQATPTLTLVLVLTLTTLTLTLTIMLLLMLSLTLQLTLKLTLSLIHI